MKKLILITLLSIASYNICTAMDNQKPSCKNGTCTPVSEEQWEKFKEDLQEMKHNFQNLKKKSAPCRALLNKDATLNEQLGTIIENLSKVSSISALFSTFEDANNLAGKIIEVKKEIMNYGIGQMCEDEYKEEINDMKKIQQLITTALEQKKELEKIPKEKETIETMLESLKKLTL